MRKNAEGTDHNPSEGIVRKEIFSDDMPECTPTEGAPSRQRGHCKVANVVRVCNLGENKFMGFTPESIGRHLTEHVC